MYNIYENSLDSFDIRHSYYLSGDPTHDVILSHSKWSFCFS